MKGVVENLLIDLGIQGVEFKNLKLNAFHTGRQASVFVNALEIGSFGEIHPSILRRLDVSQRIFFAEFNLQDLAQVSERIEKIKPSPVYPSSERDWTVTISKDVSYSELVNDIRRRSSSLLEEVSLLDVYCNEKLGSNFHNITLHFIYRDHTKTIDQESVDNEHNHVVTDVIKELGNKVK